MGLAGGHYPQEEELSRDFCSLLASRKSPWGVLRFLKEFYYIRGRTDVVAVDCQGRVLAFELKLAKWPQALHQAYRNTCFAHCSYVVVPEATAQRALRYQDEFQRRAVGLCSIIGRTLVIALEAPVQSPIQTWLSSVVVERVSPQARP